MKFSLRGKKQDFLISWVCFLGLVLLPVVNSKSATVRTSAALTPPLISVPSAAASCSYYAVDTYSNTEYVWIAPSTPLTNGSNNLTLAWTLGSNSPLVVPVPCTGTYQVFFTLQVQAASNAGAISIYPCVQTTDGLTTIIGSCPASSSGASFIYNPTCNSGTYCTVIVYPFTKNVYLTKGQVVGPPSIHTSNQIAITGGEFIVNYIGP